MAKKMLQGVFAFFSEMERKERVLQNVINEEAEAIIAQRKQEVKDFKAEQRQRHNNVIDDLVDALAVYKAKHNLSYNALSKTMRVSTETINQWVLQHQRPRLRSGLRIQHFLEEVNKHEK